MTTPDTVGCPPDPPSDPSGLSEPFASLSKQVTWEQEQEAKAAEKSVWNAAIEAAAELAGNLSFPHCAAQIRNLKR